MGAESNEMKDETKSEKFVRIATNRTNKAMKAITALENLSNHNSYSYTQEQVDAMFTQLEETLAEVKEAFAPKKVSAEKAFSFGNIAPASDDTESDVYDDDSDDSDNSDDEE